MDTFENNDLIDETENTQAPQEPQRISGVYSGSGVGRKESPFADSPYEMPHQQYHNAAYQPPYQAGPAGAAPHVEEKPKKKKKGSGKVLKGILAAVLALTVVAGSCGLTAALVNDHWEDRTERMTEDFNGKINDLQAQLQANTDAIANANAGDSVSGSPVASVDGLTPSQVYARNVRSVVLIKCEVTTYVYGQPTTGVSSGSGFILTEDGYIVTNHHVVNGADSVSVYTYTNGGEMVYPAQVIGSDANNDVAVLKVEAEGLPAVTIGSSDDLIVGDQVVAIGNPLGELTATMTVGYVSAKDRDVTTDDTTINMIQTDAAINSGNSGGPLFNMKGEVIGITTAKYSGSSSSGATIEGIGFAIPMDDVVDMLSDLMEYGYVTGAYLGVEVLSVTSDEVQSYGFPMGSRVVTVTAGSCAEAAGIKPNDIIVGVGDYQVLDNNDLLRALRKFKAGDTSTITVYRIGTGERLELTITFDEKPHADEQTPAGASGQGEMPSSGSFEEWYNYFAPFFGGGNG